MTENDISREIVDTAFQVHTKLGPGLLETVYEVIMAHELKKRGMHVERQMPVPIVYEDLKFEEGFRADLVVNGLVVIELKSVDKLAKVHKKQLLTYLRLMDRKLGLLVNFGENLIKDGISRVVNGLDD
jgi:GxxExxY protein